MRVEDLREAVKGIEPPLLLTRAQWELLIQRLDPPKPGAEASGAVAQASFVRSLGVQAHDFLEALRLAVRDALAAKKMTPSQCYRRLVSPGEDSLDKTRFQVLPSM